MKSDTAVLIQGLTKIFKIYENPIDRIRELINPGKILHKDFCAVNNVTFEIKKGEAFGVVGRNGAGKSTLLRLLSRELAPSWGEIKTSGHISLLQLGAGFNDELTGAENVRFSCRLMGFDDKKYKEILTKVSEFSEIGEFLYRPVKMYSSGMKSRLSFATAINLDTDILIADEVLAVGDIRFAQKCLAHMRAFKEKGKTVILVTHDTEMVSAFCDRAVWLMDGQVHLIGSGKNVAEEYRVFMLYGLTKNKNNIDRMVNTEFDSAGWEMVSHSPQFYGGESVKIHKCRLTNINGESLHQTTPGENVTLEIEVENICDTQPYQLGWLLQDHLGLNAIHLNNDICGTPLTMLQQKNRIRFQYSFTFPMLRSGHYSFNLGAQSVVTDREMLCRVGGVLPIFVKPIEPVGQHGYTQITNAKCQILNISDNVE